ncbi:MAG: VanW family protein [Firmicutes bacterium]|nr:VanW family protein [Bacillota bacterium]
MNPIIGALIVSVSLSSVQTELPPEPNPYIYETDGLILFEQTEEERIAEEAEKARIAEEKRLAEERRKAEEEARKAEEERILKEKENLGFTYEISSCSTNYSQSAANADRNFNMLLASDSIDGIILNPGDTFSYNDVILSHRTPERDYKAAGVISNGKIVNSIGGGICQISSTLFNSALYSKMTITERRNHSLKVGYLPAGRDATASWGTIDFCFKNELSVPVRIESKMENGTLTVRMLAKEDPKIGNIDVKVSQNKGVYTLKRYVDGVVDYTATSVYKG